MYHDQSALCPVPVSVTDCASCLGPCSPLQDSHVVLLIAEFRAAALGGSCCDR